MDRNQRQGRRQILQLVALAVLASGIGVAIALIIHWFPPEAGRESRKIDELYNVLLIVSIPVFVLVETVVLFCVWKFRMRPGEEEMDGPPIHGNTRLEVAWTAIPALLVTGLCIYAYVVLIDIEKSKPNALVVNVTGQQFAWSFGYTGPGGKMVTSDQLYLPEGRQVKFNVQATDVIHEFWVPAFRLGIDAVPGITTSYRATPQRPGRYDIVCTELCGLGHSTMRTTVYVVSSQRFASWLAQQAQPKPGPAGAPATT